MNINIPTALRTPLLFFSAWLIAGLTLMQARYVNIVVLQVALLSFAVSWPLANRLLKAASLNSQISLIATLILYFSAWQWNNLLSGIGPQSAWFFVRELVYQLLLLLQVFTFGLLLIQNNRQRQTILIVYVVLALAGYLFVYQPDSSSVMRFIFIPMLFLVSLNQTRWVEDLHKRTLGLFFIAFGLLLYLLANSPPQAPAFYDGASWTWHTIPGFMRHLLMAYLIALMIKIPAVIIYNHLTLSRKLWFSGLFQSFIPQIVQFILLMLLFFFFTAGWQAQNLSDEIKKQLQKSKAVMAEPATLPFDVSTGIWESEKGEWFLFSRTNNDTIFATLLDSTLLKKMWFEKQTLFGNGLVAYPIELDSWQSLLMKYDLWQRTRDIRFYSLNFWYSEKENKRSYFDNGREQEDDRKVFLLDTGRESGFVFGRVYMPFVSASKPQGLIAFDIVLNKKEIALSDPIVGMVSLLILIFLAINSLVIRQVVGAGDRINKTIIHKFSQLRQGIREISDGNLQFKVDMQGEDEFSELARRFNAMAGRLEKTLQEAREKDRLNQEWVIAREVQLDLLPRQLPHPKGFKVVANLQTAQEVSGDLYDMIRMDNGNYLFTVGDVSGKGASAAFYMAQFISLFRLSARFMDQPDKVALAINSYIRKHINDAQIFITAIIGTLNPDTGELQWVRCGHNAPVILSGGKPRVAETKGIGLGLTDSEALFTKSLEICRHTLAKNESLLLFTDGLTEATRVDDGQKAQYGDERFLELLRENQDLPADELIKELSHDLDIFYGGQPRVDDVTIMIIQKNGPVN